MNDLDFKLLSGKFNNTNLSPEFSYLHSYFKSDLCKAFVSYHFAFSELINQKNTQFFLNCFVDHTGYKCSEQRLRFLLKRLQYIFKQVKDAEDNFDLDKIEQIRDGKYKLAKNISSFGENHEKEKR